MVYYDIGVWEKEDCFLFPSRKLIAYCMRKREPSDSLKYILVMLLFHFCLHIFCLFLGLAI
uniref:Uncharacterized protein n=2 Tax=Ursus TaxID=9639 RepID=A0A452VH05_URSMA